MNRFDVSEINNFIKRLKNECAYPNLLGTKGYVVVVVVLKNECLWQ
jgi:hypothetical protein